MRDLANDIVLAAYVDGVLRAGAPIDRLISDPGPIRARGQKNRQKLLAEVSRHFLVPVKRDQQFRVSSVFRSPFVQRDWEWSGQEAPRDPFMIELPTEIGMRATNIPQPWENRLWRRGDYPMDWTSRESDRNKLWIDFKWDFAGNRALVDYGLVAATVAGGAPASLRPAPISVLRARSTLSGWKSAFPEISTPQGPAQQWMSSQALLKRSAVAEGAELYRMGTLGESRLFYAEQHWAFQHPQTPGYSRAMGIPPENVRAADFIVGGRLRPGVPFVTRPAPAVGENLGGGLEAVAPPGGVGLKGASFSPRGWSRR